MQKIKFSVYFVFISIFTFVTLFILIVQNSYSNLVKPISQIDNTVLTPINSNLDLSVIDEIEKREDFAASNTPVTLTSTISAVSAASISTSSSSIKPAVTPKL